MSLLGNLFNRNNIECPRCLGKGEVDWDDIKRLNKELRWLPGRCAYCNGSGKVSSKMISSVKADETYLTTDISPDERKRLFASDEGATQRAKYRSNQYNDLIKQIEYLHFIGKLDADKIIDFLMIPGDDSEEKEMVRKQMQDYVPRVIKKKSL